MNETSRIEINPAICHGKPVVKGTRIPVSIIVGSLASGMSMEQTQMEYGLSKEEIQVALAFASELIQQESFHNLPRVA